MRFRQVHLDFHTGDRIPGVGSGFVKKQFQEALQLGCVDSITVFSKCHHGWAYHPSKANEMHPSLTFDLLGAQIEAAHEIGVKTPVYLSVGFDEKIAQSHSQWLRRREPDYVSDFSVPKYHEFCLNTPYLDILLEQVREVCENYDADGIFLDIVGVKVCYCDTCTAQLRREGKDPADPAAVLALAERVYANFTGRVRETIDSVKPGLPLFFNAGHIPRGRRDLARMNTHLELESLPTGGWGYDNFPLTARYVQQLGMEYLGMTGKFHGGWGEFGGFKHPNALRYEVSLAAANGAGSSVGDQAHPCARMDMATYRLIGAAYSELKEKEPWLKDVKPVTEVALLSLEAYRNAYVPGSPKEKKVDAGAGRILLEGKYLFDVVDVDSDLSGYRVLILPDEIRITADLKEKLDGFVAGGGKLLATGFSGLYWEKAAFAFNFGAYYVGESALQPCYFAPREELEGLYPSAYVLYRPGQDVALTDGQVLGQLYKPYFNRTAAHFCSHRHTPNETEPAGAGMVEGKDGIYIGWSVFAEYAEAGALIAKRMVQYALDRLLGEEKLLKTDLGAQGVVTLMEQDERYVNHLLYAVPVKRGSGVEIIEDIQPVYHVNVSLKLPEKIRRVYLAPSGEKLPFRRENGRISFTLPKLECHQMVVLEKE